MEWQLVTGELSPRQLEKQVRAPWAAAATVPEGSVRRREHREK